MIKRHLIHIAAILIACTLAYAFYVATVKAMCPQFDNGTTKICGGK